MIESKKYSIQQKSLKARDNSKIKKTFLRLQHLRNTQHMESQNTRVKDVDNVI